MSVDFNIGIQNGYILNGSGLVEGYGQSIIDFFDPTLGLPVNPAKDDKYIATATANGWVNNNIEYFDGTNWKNIEPTAANLTFISNLGAFRLYNPDTNTWTELDSGISGPGISTTDGVPRFTDNTGTSLSNSNVLIDGADNMTVPLGSLLTTDNLDIITSADFTGATITGTNFYEKPVSITPSDAIVKYVGTTPDIEAAIYRVESDNIIYNTNNTIDPTCVGTICQGDFNNLDNTNYVYAGGFSISTSESTLDSIFSGLTLTASSVIYESIITGDNNGMLGDATTVIDSCAVLGGFGNNIDINPGSNSLYSGIFEGRICSIESSIAGSSLLGNIILGSETCIISHTVAGAMNDNAIISSDNCIITDSTNSTIINGNGSSITGSTDSVVIGDLGSTTHDNCLVFGDGNIRSTTGNQQIILGSSGGTTIFTDNAGTTGASLASGLSAWAAVCDINKKENLKKIKNVLPRLSKIPIYEYNYKGHDTAVINISPTAQDWHEQFTSKKDKLRIDTMDISGVALAGIKELHNIILDLKSEINELREEIIELKKINK